jgi:parallel beta-helix repeat protein
VEIIGADSSDARVLGNFIGLNLNGSGFSEIGNTLDGVFVSTATQVEIGGALSGQGNTISDNGNNGVQLFGFTTTNNKVFGNHIGTNKNGSSDFGNARDGVLIRSSGNDIGGAATGARNVISGNDRYGVHLLGSDGNEVQGNSIGTDRNGTSDVGNTFSGVLIEFDADNNIIGGTDPGAGNVISGNNLHGAQISQSPTGNQVLGNFIGTDMNGTSDLGNFFDGVHLEGNVSENEVASNTISGNGTGVEIFGARASGNDVSSNLIGTDASGTTGLGNSGFGVFINAPDNFIGSTVSGEGNTIAFNGQEGVVIAGGAATGNRILRNSIFSNGGLGIDLIGGTENANGATANDPDDPDTGPNTLQNKPVLTSFSGLTIEGNLNSTPNRTFVIQFFGNLQGENEGRFFLGQESVTTNSNGNVNFTFTAPAAPIETQNVTATATRAGSTSEFSAASPAE